MAKRNRWQGLGAVSYVRDPFARHRNHATYADKGGYFVVHSGGDDDDEEEREVIAEHATSRIKCEEIARARLAADKSRELGKFVGKPCVFRAEWDKPWQAGRIRSVSVEERRYFHKVISIEGSAIFSAQDCHVVSSPKRAAMLAILLNRLEKEARALSKRADVRSEHARRILSRCAAV